MAGTGTAHMAVVTETGNLWTWGWGEGGQLGHADSNDRQVPVMITPDRFANKSVLMAACGGLHTVAVTVDGTLYTWGHGGYGQLGHDSRDNTQVPLLVTKFQEEGELCMTAEVRHVPPTANTVAIVSVRGTGSLPDTGMLEDGGSQENSNQRPEDSAIQESGFQKFVMSPRVSKVNTNTVHVLMAAAGRAHTGIVTTNGLIFTWGSGSGGQLGHNDLEDRLIPTLIPPHRLAGTRANFVACGRDFTCAITEEEEVRGRIASPGGRRGVGGGALYSWGSNSEGALGLNDVCDRQVPTLVAKCRGLAGSSAVVVACGVAHSAAVTEDGSLLVWGSGEHGRLGLGDTHRRLVPTRMPPDQLRAGAGSGKVAMVAVGGKHSVAVTEDGAVYSWGYGEFGRLGHNDTLPRLLPTRVLFDDTIGRHSKRVSMAACGASHTAVVTETGALYTWGDAESGQLGHDTSEHKLVPALLPSSFALNGALVGHFRRLRTEHSVAFAMVSHRRLGADSVFSAILHDLIKLIIQEAHVWPVGRAGQVDGLARLLGGGLIC